MALWDRLRTEIDRAGKAAQTAFDEGRTRLELGRARQLADRAAQALGHAVFDAREAGGELDQDSYSRLASTLSAHRTEIARLEEELRREGSTPDTPAGAGADTGAPAGASTGAGPSGSPASSEGTGAPGPSGAAGNMSDVSPAMGDDPGSTGATGS